MLVISNHRRQRSSKKWQVLWGEKTETVEWTWKKNLWPATARWCNHCLRKNLNTLFLRQKVNSVTYLGRPFYICFFIKSHSHHNGFYWGLGSPMLMYLYPSQQHVVWQPQVTRPQAKFTFTFCLYKQSTICVVVAQLAARSLPIPENPGSNQVKRQLFEQLFSYWLFVVRTKS